LLLGLGLWVSEPERFLAQDHYLDSEDLHLFRVGWALRLRDLGTRQLLTLKALRPSRAGIARREEREETLEWNPRQGWEFPPSALGGQVARLLEGRPLVRLFSLRQDRTLYQTSDREELWVEASCDLVRWSQAEREEVGCFLELELKKGPEEALAELVQAVRAESGWPPACTSKFERGMRLAGLLPAC